MELRPSIYFQFDGFEAETYRILRGEPSILPQKLRALDRLTEIGAHVVLVPAVDRFVNLHEVGAIVEFGLKHPGVRGVNFQPAFQSGRHGESDPMQRLTIPDILQALEEQMGGTLLVSDFVPVPCCFPTCNAVTYVLNDRDTVLPMTTNAPWECWSLLCSAASSRRWRCDIERRERGSWPVCGKARTTRLVL